jgi:hypothetical protein
MNFVVANLDYPADLVAGGRGLTPKPLADGLPGHWSRPGLFEAYREAFAAGVLAPALHGAMHFCLKAVTRSFLQSAERAQLLRTLWLAETPYIHWRMPWVGYEYWDPEQSPSERFIPENEQQQWISWAAEAFRKFFREGPVSACAPGYRADATTHRLWQAQGIRVAQNGPGKMQAPHFDEHGLLHTYRSFDFEPALNAEVRAGDCAGNAERWLSWGLPLIVSVHSINFHSTLAPFRQKTLPILRELLDALRKKFPDLLFVNDRQLPGIVQTGSYESESGRIRIAVTKVRKGAEA